MDYKKKLSLIFIKFGPSLMALTCSTKILLLTYGFNIITRYINIGLNVIILLGLYFLGKTFGYCWKHKSLCRIAFWGYLFYTLFLSLSGSLNLTAIRSIVIFYMIIVVWSLIMYGKDIKCIKN